MTDRVSVFEDGIDATVPGDESIRELLGDRPLDQPIELLVQLADEGEIDPWDIDLIAVTDAFLDRIEGDDLIVTARTLFYASVLLRMKSDEIVGAAEPGDPEEVPPPEHFDDPRGDPVATLEREMDRRLTRKTARGTPATLADLIRELRQAERERWWKERRTYDTTGNGHRGPQTLDYRSMVVGEQTDAAIQTVATTPHREDLEGALEPLIERLSTAFESDDHVAFEYLSDLDLSRAVCFRTLLFLEHRGAVELEQDQLYGPLSVTPGVNELEEGEEMLDLEDDRDG